VCKIVLKASLIFASTAYRSIVLTSGSLYVGESFDFGKEGPEPCPMERHALKM
jgi:hypothetical protein